MNSSFLWLVFGLFLANAAAHAQQGGMRRMGGVSEGQLVAKVSAVDQAGKRVDLSSPKRFTVLVFGSHT